MEQSKSTNSEDQTIVLEKELEKMREILRKRQRAVDEDEIGDEDDKCSTRWVAVDDSNLKYYGFKHTKFCNIHWVNKVLYVVHRPNSKTPVKCHCCGQLCVPQFLCIPCSGEINKYKYRRQLSQPR